MIIYEQLMTARNDASCPGRTSRRVAGWLGVLLLWCCLAPGLRAEPTNDNLLVYSEMLNNGWQDWGWVNHYATNGLPATTDKPPAGLTNCMVFAATGGYQAWWLVHDPINSALYTNLILWVNGGPTGGQYVGIEAQGTSWGPRVSLTAPTNQWQEFTFSLAALGVANITNLTGFQIWNGSAAQPAFYLANLSLTANPPPAVVNVVVNVTNTVRTMAANLFGINQVAWDGNVDTPTSTGILNDLGNPCLRWPGGSWGDGYHWTNEPDSEGYVNRNWGSFSTNFIALATNTHAQAFIIVNYGSSDAGEAAYGVRMFNITNHCGFKYWEVGNEVGGSWEEDDNTNAPWQPHDPWTYAMRFTDYYNQMKAVDPTIKVGAVADITEDGTSNYTNHPVVNPRTGVTHNGWTPVMLTYMRSNGITPDFLIEHKYAPADGDTYGLLYFKGWAADAVGVRQMVTDYLGSAGTNVTLESTESGTAGDCQSVSLVGGLMYADDVGQIMQTELNSRLWWDMRNGQSAIVDSDNALYGWRTNASGAYIGDGGIVYNLGAPGNRYPTYYVAKLLSYFARGGDRVVTVTNNYPLLGTYAVQRTNGTLTLLVLNKSAYASLTAVLAIKGYVPGSNAVVYSYGMTQDNAAETGIGSPDIATNSLTGAGASFSAIFPPYSASVLSLAPAAPRLVVPAGQAPGQFAFQLWGQAGVPYIIQKTTHLNGIWNSQSTNTVTGNYASITNSISNPAMPAFYRAVWEP